MPQASVNGYKSAEELYPRDASLSEGNMIRLMCDHPIMSFLQQRVAFSYGLNGVDLRDVPISVIRGVKNGKTVTGRNAEFFLMTDPEEEQKFETVFDRSPTVYDLIVNCNYRLSASMARRYESPTAPFEDLFQEGNMGILTAIPKFDIRRGYKFSTYANWWIRQKISKEVAQRSRTIRLPDYMHDRMHWIREAVEEFRTAENRDPKETELIEQLTISRDLAEEVARRAVTVYFGTGSTLRSLDDKRSPESSDSIADTVAGSSDTATDAIKNLRINETIVRQIVARLPEGRDRSMLEARFGLDGKGWKSLRRVGSEFGLTGERVRQVQEALIRQIIASYPDLQQEVELD